jgi:hypothetical protein
MILLFGKNSAFAKSNDLGIYVMDQTIGYQIGYSSSQKPIMQSFDYNGIFFMFMNGGYNYQSNIGSKAFVGVGLSFFLQIQYGYAFCSRNHIFRIRSDTPIALLWDNKLWNSTYLHSLSIGVFAETQFVDNLTKRYCVGVSLGVSLMDIKFQYNERKLKREMELWENKKNNGL